jgi:two-component system response regulator FixJ
MNTHENNYKLFVVDDDASICDAISVVFDLDGFETRSFYNGSSFLNALGEGGEPDAILLDVHMPDQSGLDILRILQDKSYHGPVFMISGQGDIPIAVDAIKKGAHDFIEKPLDASLIVQQVRDAIEKSAHAGSQTMKHDFPGHELLTPRERQVLGEIVEGASNREVGEKLGISPRTVEVHRARIMEKLNAKNAADLVRIVLSIVH